MSQTAVWALPPLMKGLLPQLLASAGNLFLILSHYLQLDPLLGGTYLEQLSFFPPDFLGKLGLVAIQLFPFFLQHKEYTDKSPKNKTANDKRPLCGLNSIMQVQ